MPCSYHTAIRVQSMEARPTTTTGAMNQPETLFESNPTGAERADVYIFFGHRHNGPIGHLNIRSRKPSEVLERPALSTDRFVNGILIFLQGREGK
jgi:hypothetical protein